MLCPWLRRRRGLGLLLRLLFWLFCVWLFWVWDWERPRSWYSYVRLSILLRRADRTWA